MPGRARGLQTVEPALWMTAPDACAGDIAAKHLEGKVKADRYVAGEICEIIEPSLRARAADRRCPAADTGAHGRTGDDLRPQR